MRRILDVARREYMETVKTKAFLIGLLFVPVIIVGVILFTGRMATSKQGPRAPLRVAFTTDAPDLAQKNRGGLCRVQHRQPEQHAFDPENHRHDRGRLG